MSLVIYGDIVVNSGTDRLVDSPANWPIISWSFFKLQSRFRTH